MIQQWIDTDQIYDDLSAYRVTKLHYLLMIINRSILKIDQFLVYSR